MLDTSYQNCENIKKVDSAKTAKEPRAKEIDSLQDALSVAESDKNIATNTLTQ